MGSPRQPLRTSPDGSQASRDAALSGANLAFIKSLPPREALAYLNKHSPPPAPKEKHQQNVRSTSSYSLARHDGPVSTRTSPDHLRLPKRPPHKTTPSASSLTATIAAARAAPNLVNASTRPPSKPPVRAAGNLAPPTAPKRNSRRPPSSLRSRCARLSFCATRRSSPSRRVWNRLTMRAPVTRHMSLLETTCHPTSHTSPSCHPPVAPSSELTAKSTTSQNPRSMYSRLLALYPPGVPPALHPVARSLPIPRTCPYPLPSPDPSSLATTVPTILLIPTIPPLLLSTISCTLVA
jgi:hypothetical protein